MSTFLEIQLLGIITLLSVETTRSNHLRLGLAVNNAMSAKDVSSCMQKTSESSSRAVVGGVP